MTQELQSFLQPEPAFLVRQFDKPPVGALTNVMEKSGLQKGLRRPGIQVQISGDNERYLHHAQGVSGHPSDIMMINTRHHFL